MKVGPEALSARLGRQLSPVYLISGDDVLRVQEAVAAVRSAARAAGCAERELHTADRSFDWDAFASSTRAMSLFAEKRLLELRLLTSGPGERGARALVEYCESPPPDTILLVSMGKLDRAAPRSRWYGALDKAGAIVQVWPLDARQLPDWIAGRMRARSMQPSRAAVALLAERVEGNLLAAVQEIEKLHLLHGEGTISDSDVAEAVANSTRFDVYQLVDAALSGNAARTSRVVQRLRDEGVEPVLALWAVARELRQLAVMAAEIGATPLEAVLSRHRVWAKRKPLLKAALTRHTPTYWQQLLLAAGRVDRVAKGAAAGNAWDELLQLALMIAGVRHPSVTVDLARTGA